jgi:hypothetical protein
VITCGGITTDLLRNLLDEEDLQPKLLAARIPPCALATVDDPTVVMIASTAPLMSLSSTATHNRYRFTSRDSRQNSEFSTQAAMNKNTVGRLSGGL